MHNTKTCINRQFSMVHKPQKTLTFSCSQPHNNEHNPYITVRGVRASHRSADTGYSICSALHNNYTGLATPASTAPPSMLLPNGVPSNPSLSRITSALSSRYYGGRRLGKLSAPSFCHNIDWVSGRVMPLCSEGRGVT